MTSFLGKISTNLILNKTSNSNIIIRYGHHLRGKPPGIARSLKQRMQEIKDKSFQPVRIDIGLPPPQISRSTQLKERLNILKANKQNPKLEKLARDEKLKINLNEVNEEWLKTSAYHTIRKIADHYGVFKDLFGDAYFNPVLPITVTYENEGCDYPVCFGNAIKPQEASKEPRVQYEADKNTLWTLVMTNPDGHLRENNKEYVHWFISNIPNNEVEKGEVIYKYLAPFPPKGTGFHRIIFVLYKQEKKIDFSTYKKENKYPELDKRTFSTLDFYRKHQDLLTPTSLSFFQCDWDKSLTDFYHNTLNIKEPIFEYDFDPPYIRKPEWFPLRQPFNLYMDKYRDPKQINKEFLERKFKKVHPFKAPKPPVPYPNALYLDQKIPSWLKLEIRKSRMKWGRINDIE